MGRKDFYYDSDAPTAQTIVVAASVFALNTKRELLLIRRTDNDRWALPGGTQEIGERIADAAVRETLEETGISVSIEDVIGIYSDPNHVQEYSDGEVRQEFSICFRAHPIAGSPRPSEESHEVRWMKPADLNSLDIHPSMRLRIKHGLEERIKPYIG